MPTSNRPGSIPRAHCWSTGCTTCATDGHSAWARGQVGPITFIHKNLDYARSALEKGVAQQEYVDAHHWKFTPASFSLLIQDLRDLGYHSFVEVASHPTVGFEFYATLSLGEREEGNRKDRIALLTQARAEQVEVSPTHVKLRADLDDVERVSGLPIAALSSHLQAMNQRAAEAEARVKLAETQIAQLKTSTSWRVTRPLRGLADLARKLR